MAGLPHLRSGGQAHMVDVSRKDETERRAVATARVRMHPETASLLADDRLPKGDAAAVARVAGIMAAKRTPEMIPLCHPVTLAGVDVDFDVDAAEGVVHVRAVVHATDRTGVEMEALLAASVAALTLYDMVKAVERGVVVEAVQLEEKAGGRRGAWVREQRRDPEEA